MTSKHGDGTMARLGRPGASMAVALALALGACSSGKRSPLTGVVVSPGPAYLSVGATQQLTATGTYGDGSTKQLDGVTWSSSDETVVTVNAGGLATGVGKGTAKVTASASGVSGTVDVTSRVVTPVPSPGRGQPPQVAAAVDTSEAYLKVSGLTPGAFYEPTLDQLKDDVDLYVYQDASLSSIAELCSSENVGTTPEACVAPANAAGELYVLVDGTWSELGSDFLLTVPGATPDVLKSSLAFPSKLPMSGTVDGTSVVYEVTGLGAGARYEVRLSQLTADLDLEVYGDPYLYAPLCASFRPGLVDDACTAAASASGKLYVEVDGESTNGGGAFTMSVTPR